MAKRTDKSKDIVKVPGASGSFLTKYVETDQSLAAMQPYVIVPRIKIIQAMTDAELKKKLGPDGTVCVRPGDGLLGPPNGSFLFVPQFFFSEFALWADRKDKESPRIIRRSYDATSDIAKAAANETLRYEVYEGHEKKPEKDRWKRSNVHHFCWVGVIYGDHELKGQQAVLSMERGEWGNGRRFISAISMRRHQPEGMDQKVPVPLWAQVWELKSAFRDKGDKKWWGFDFSGPSEAAPIITDEEGDAFHEEHLRLAQLHEQSRLRVDHAEGDDTDGTEGADAGTAEKPKGKF